MQADQQYTALFLSCCWVATPVEKIKMERSEGSNKRKAPQAPFARLVAADELGLLKGKLCFSLLHQANLLTSGFLLVCSD